MNEISRKAEEDYLKLLEHLFAEIKPGILLEHKYSQHTFLVLEKNRGSHGEPWISFKIWNLVDDSKTLINTNDFTFADGHFSAVETK